MHLPGVKIPLLALLLCGATASWGGDYLYAPRPVDGAEPGEGVLVREVTVKKGDTLYSLSRQYGCKVAKIKEWNKDVDDNLQIGDKIKIVL